MYEVQTPTVKAKVGIPAAAEAPKASYSDRPDEEEPYDESDEDGSEGYSGSCPGKLNPTSRGDAIDPLKGEGMESFN